MKLVSSAVTFGLLGLVVGYLIYGKIAGDYVSLSTLFATSNNVLESAVQSLAGIDAMRSKILMCGAVGAVIGVVVRLLPILK